MAKYQAVFFDLDGTLMDTAPDIATAVRYVQQQFMPNTAEPICLEALKEVISYGGPGIIPLAFGLPKQDENYPYLSEAILAHYETCMKEQVCLFPGFLETLDALEQKHIPWGVISNKPERLVHLLMEHLNLHQRAVIIIGGDTLPRKKPHPAPLLHGCQQVNTHPEKTLYVGDCEHDILAAQAARMPSAIAEFGYIPKDQSHLRWGADFLLSSPQDLLKLF